ncbi:MAG: saccharopine dehydrogenase NADP-binding domain-containing protein [Bacteroidota bacterium]
MPRPYALTLFGATGFTGGLVADYLAQHAPPDTAWALAGRNLDKLRPVRRRLAEAGADVERIGLVVADSSDPASLRAMTEQTRVVASTVGPFAQVGEPLVQACVQTSTDYADITGEPNFWKRMIGHYHRPAHELGLKLVPCCGFDSVPADLGTFFTVGQLPDTGQPVTVEGFVTIKGKFSGGTWASALQAMAEGTTKVPGGADAANVGSVRPLSATRNATRAVPFQSEVMDRWAYPLPVIDPMVVRRSAQFITGYGDGFAYGHYGTAKSVVQVGGLVGGAAGAFALAQFGPTRRWLKSLNPQGAGPSEDDRAAGFFRLTFHATSGDQTVTAKIEGGDPGYTETAKMLAEAALALAFDRDTLPETAGLLTPASALGLPYLQRLQQQGIRFEVLSTAAPATSSAA